MQNILDSIDIDKLRNILNSKSRSQGFVVNSDISYALEKSLKNIINFVHGV